jgi:tetratricopeptide (TPR) repeat protein
MRDQLDDIEKYLMDKLTGSERKTFEKKMKDDPSLQDRVDHYRSLLEGIELGFNRELKSLLQEEEIRIRDLKSKEKSKTRRLYYTLGIAASITLLIIMVFTTKDQLPDNETLFITYYQPYPNIESPVSRSENNKENPYAFYENENYSEALDLFAQLNDKNPSDPAPVFYSGICNLELNNTERAISFFKSIQKYNDNKYTRPANWYLALSYVKNNNKRDALAILEMLADGDDIYSNKSQELLKHTRK